MADRRRANRFSSERRANFGKNVRNEFLSAGRDQKDAERMRMEAYRKICAEEGIESARLKEYDETKKKASEALSKQLDEVDDNQSLTNNEKKRKKYNLKRKFAATTVNDIIQKKQKKYSAVANAEKIGQKRQAEKEQRAAAKAQREQDKKDCLAARRERNHLFSQRTSRGQPVLSSRVESLLQRVSKLNGSSK